MSTPVRLHPHHPRYFEFRGRPLALICATEHYGAVLNRRFDFARYLEDHAEKKQTLTRLFLLFRELQTHCNPYSPCKPESPDYIAPWPRVGPKKALDGEPQYDLSRWNEEYFERLHHFCRMASDLGIVIEITLFSNTYADNIWALNPLHADNNIQGIGAVSHMEYNTCREEALFSKHVEYTRKIVDELNLYDNIYFEICNEPGTSDSSQVGTEEIEAWQAAIARTIREAEASLPQRHLIFGGQVFSYPPFRQEMDAAFANPDFDAVNVHPLTDIAFGGRNYDLGVFMSKQLRLAEFRDFTLAVSREPKPCVHDEDNIASCYRDETGWTIHRKRAWTALMCGAHYDMIDFSIVVHREDGTEESRAKLRSWMKHLSAFVHSMDIARAKPLGDWLLQKPSGVVESTLAVEGEDYAVYLADPREVTDDETTNVGNDTLPGGQIRFALPDGEYLVSFYSPVTGSDSPAVALMGGGEASVELPPFQHDIAIRIKRRR